MQGQPQLSRSLVNLNRNYGLNISECVEPTRNIFTGNVESVPKTTIDQQPTQRSAFVAEVRAKTGAVSFGQQRRESAQNYVTVSPSSQTVFVAQQRQIYSQQQDIFAEIKRKNGMQSNGFKVASNFGQEAKENLLTASIQQISIDYKTRQQHAAKRCLTSQVGDRLRLSSRPGPTYPVQNKRPIGQIEETIFKD